LVTSANAFHNYGTIQAYEAHFYNNYLFNSGVIKLGEIPTKVEDLSGDPSGRSRNVPAFKKNVIENYGTFMVANGKFQIKDELNYHEHKTGYFKDLEMFGGDLIVHENGRTSVAGTLSGTIRDIKVGNDAKLLITNYRANPNVRNLEGEKDSVLHVVGPLNITPTGGFVNSGQISSGDRLNLNISCGLSADQRGQLIAPNGAAVEVARHDTHKPMLSGPPLLKDPGIARYLRSHAPRISYEAVNAYIDTPEMQRLQEEYYNRIGQRPEVLPGSNSAGRVMSKKRKEIVYTDYYLNTIMYHYDAYGRLERITETGYIWQRRTKKEIDLYDDYPSVMDLLMDELNEEAKTPPMEAMNALLRERKRKDLNTAIRREGAGPIGDLASIRLDSVMWELAKKTNPDYEDALLAHKPELVDARELLDDAREHLSEHLDMIEIPSDRRFIEDIVIPAVMVAVLTMGDIIAPEFAPVTAPALAVSCARLAPVIEKAAIAIGLGELYRQTRTFFNEAFDSGPARGRSGGPSGGSPTPRSQAPYTKAGGQRLASGFQKHLNKLDSLRETIVYAIKDRSGRVMKYGETAAGYFNTPGKTHLLKRPQRQRDQALKRGDPGKYFYEEISKFPTKREARAFETQRIDQARRINPDACPWNKGRH
jgi:hypothetical protein